MNFNEMKLPELKSLAKERKLKGYSSKNKDQLIEELEMYDKDVTAETESVVEAIKTAIRNDKETRSNKGRAASLNSFAASKMLPADKAYKFRLQRGSESARLTPKQAKRVRKTEAKLYNRSRGFVCSGFGSTPFTYA